METHPLINVIVGLAIALPTIEMKIDVVSFGIVTFVVAVSYMLLKNVSRWNKKRKRRKKREKTLGKTLKKDFKIIKELIEDILYILIISAIVYLLLLFLFS